MLEHEESQVVELRERLMTSLGQAEQHKFVDGDGKDAVRRVFAYVRAGQV